jgi:sialidase-1
VVEVGPGRLLAMARHEGRPGGVLWQFESSDGGHSWTEPRPTTILGKPPHLIRLRDGRVLVTYGYRHAPFGERACFSHDGGGFWDCLVLRDDAPNADLGYPASVELEDGTILSVYYQVEKPGEKTCLMATRWKM